MASKPLKNIFLSASIPLRSRDPKYYDTADVIAIRDAIIALATVVLPTHKLIWGGHPSITPLITFVMKKLDLNIQEHVLIYQSQFFAGEFSEDNEKIQNIEFTENLGNEELSILHMRKRLFSENKFVAGVFIGGMEGLETEYNMFRETNINALSLPLASTGAASRLIYEKLPAKHKNDRLTKDYGFMSLFQQLLIEKL